MMTNRQGLLLPAFMLSTLVSFPTAAQDPAANFPSRPVQIVAATSPGGPTEREVRLYTIRMSELMGQSFVLDFKPGAGNVIGTNFVAKSAPSGYTVLIVPSTFSMMAATARNLPFDPIADFAPVSLMSVRSAVMVVNPSVPAKDIQEYLTYARANPGKLNFGDSGRGGAGHMAGSWFHNLTGTKVTFVHYKGTGPSTLDLVAGRVDVAMEALTIMMPLIKSGKVRALAIASERRTHALPQLQTIAEQGVPGYNYSSWLGFVVPAGTPPAIVNKLSENFALTARTPEIVKALEADGSFMVGNTPAQFRELILAETERWRKVVKDADIKLEE